MALAVLKSFFSLAPLLNWRVLDKVGICLKLLLSSSVCDLFFHILLSTRSPPTGPSTLFLRRLASNDRNNAAKWARLPITFI